MPLEGRLGTWILPACKKVSQRSHWDESKRRVNCWEETVLDSVEKIASSMILFQGFYGFKMQQFTKS